MKKSKLFLKLLALALPLSAALHAMAQGGPDREKMREALDSCASELGIAKPEPGQRPSDENRKAMESCLAGKGFTRPSGQRPPPPQGQQGGNELGAAASTR